MTVTHLPISRVNFMPCQFHGYFPRVFSQYFSLKFSIKLMRNLECGHIKDDGYTFANFTCQFHAMPISWVFPTRIFTVFLIKIIEKNAGPYMLIPISFHSISH